MTSQSPYRSSSLYQGNVTIQHPNVPQIRFQPEPPRKNPFPLERVAHPAPLIGYRSWELKGTELWSLGMGESLWTRDMTAVCRAPRVHKDPVPFEDCECGIYVWASPCWDCYGAVYGAIHLWGKVLVHGDWTTGQMEVEEIEGYRAEHARILALVDYTRPGQPPMTESLEKVANAYQVPLVASTEALVMLAREIAG